MSASAQVNSHSGPETTRETGTNIVVQGQTNVGFAVSSYTLKGDTLLSTNGQAPPLESYTGTNVSVADLVKAAAQVQNEYRKRNYPAPSVAIAPERITNGVVTMHLFKGGAVPQILVAGKRYAIPEASGATAANPNAPGPPPGTNTPAVQASAPRGIKVEHYVIGGDTLLSMPTLESIFMPHIGTNVPVQEIVKAASDLQMAYRTRGYVTVAVTLPPQQVTNGIVNVKVTEGRLAQVIVQGNRYFSSNNVMRAFPNLKTNTLLNGFVLQGELDRANANRDRQISPELAQGAELNTSDLYLKVKDRLPLHGHLELNNYNTPDTPTLRLNSSLVYNNLWQLEHAAGLQYTFSPEVYKTGSQWNFYDLPLIANYSAYYRMPLAGPSDLEQQVTSNPANFGYSEATRQFRLPPASGLPEANVYASRSAIDTGVLSTQPQRFYTSTNQTIDQVESHQDFTINGDVGMRLSQPLPQIGGIPSILSFGLDYKTYDISSYATNTFIFTQYRLDEHGNPLPPLVTPVSSRVPPSSHYISYIPLNLRWSGNQRDRYGATDFYIGYAPNIWFSGGVSNLQAITGSTQSSGFWHIVTSGAGREQTIYKDWKVSLRADGQWANQPLISTEQYGVGGVASVRGYHEGEVFGDLGWRVSLEPKSPPILSGRLFDLYPLYMRYSIFMDYGQAFLLDPQGRQGRTDLWGTGAGLGFTIGSHWDGRFAVAVPLLSTPNVRAGEGRVYFSLDAQF